MKEQRRAPRFRHELIVELHERRGARKLHAVDVARHGLFLATADPPRERHLVQLTVHLPNGPIRAAGSVTRTLRGKMDHVDGVGIQFFALSDDAKERWDDFIFELQRATPARGTPVPSLDELRAPEPAHAPSGGSTFLVKLKTEEKLREFATTHIAAGGTVLFTPVLRAEGDVVTLTVVHPRSDEEFKLPGLVSRAHSDRPKRLEILFHGVTPALLRSFELFVSTGHPPRVQLDPPVLPPTTPAPEHELHLDVEYFDDDDDLLDPEEGWRPPGDVTAPPQPHAPEVAPPLTPLDEPGLRPATFLVRCDSCEADAYAIDLGASRGMLGLVADHCAFISQYGRVVTALRLVAQEVRDARTKAFFDGGGARDATLPVSLLLDAVALADPPFDDDGPLKHTRAVERLEHAAQKSAIGDEPVKTRVACPACSGGHVTVEKVAT